MPRSLAEIEAFLYAQADRLYAERTPEERIMCERLGAGHFTGDWRCQYPMILLGVRGKVHGVVFDFYHPQAKLALELDGKHHKKGPDARRDRAALFNGIKTLRHQNTSIHNDLASVLAEITETVKERLNA
jgi:very-short-patch-repair endonuclease